MNSRPGLRVILILTAGLLLSAVSAFAQSSPRDLFEQARMLDESNQHLTEAIALYKQVASLAVDERALAAQAQLRVGLLYERMGQRDEAQLVYEQVTRSFAEENPAVEARKRLIAIRQQVEEETIPDITLRQIMSGGGDVATILSDAAITPDGRYVISTEWDSGNFEMRDLETDEVQLLRLRPEGQASEGDPEGPRVSADGEWLAYSLYNNDVDRYDLRIISLDGTDSRVLYDDESVSWTYPSAWSADGRQILAGISRKDEHYDIALVSVATGEAKVLKTLDQGVWPIGEVLSPDQRFVAYSRPVVPGSDNWDIYLLPTDGSAELPLIQHPAEDYVLGWAPDGRYILFASRRRGSLGVFLQPVDGGKPGGEPRMVKADMWGVSPLGFTRDGSFYYAQDTSVEDVYVAEVDIEEGTVVSPPAPLIKSRYEGPNARPALSRDGEFFVTVGLRGPEAWWYAREQTLNITSFETGESHRLDLSIDANPTMVYWTASGDSLVIGGRDENRNPCLYRASAVTGQTRIWECRNAEEMVPGTFFGISPDASRIYYTQYRPDGWYIAVRNPDAGTEEVVYTSKRGRTLALSPDGLQIAFVNDDEEPKTLMLMPSSGGVPRMLATAPGGIQDITSMAFLPNGRGLVYSVRSLEGREQLWYAPIDGGGARSLPLETEALWSLLVHPDGRRIFFTSRERSAELWVMEGFLPEQTGSE